MREIAFNINNCVKVKLTDRGREVVAEKDRHWTEAIPGVEWSSVSPKPDEDGWTKWQMWELMNLFGPYCAMGIHVPFDTTIKFVLPTDEMAR